MHFFGAVSVNTSEPLNIILVVFNNGQINYFTEQKWISGIVQHWFKLQLMVLAILIKAIIWILPYIKYYIEAALKRKIFIISIYAHITMAHTLCRILHVLKTLLFLAMVIMNFRAITQFKLSLTIISQQMLSPMQSKKSNKFILY